MAVKENDQDYDAINNNPTTHSLFNYSGGGRGVFPPPGSSFMITEITEDFMITESGDFMITEF